MDLQVVLQVIKAWRAEHLRILILVEKIKVGFSGILFTVFCCDLLAMASFVSQLLNNAVDMRTVFSKSRLCGNLLLFMAYQTICVVPLVSANEQVIQEVYGMIQYLPGMMIVFYRPETWDQQF